MIVPLDTGHLTCFATDARRHVDVLANLILAARALTGNGSRMGRDFLNLKRSWITHLMPSFLYLLDLDEEAFELRSVGVRIDCGRRKQIYRSQRGLALVFCDAAIAPMNRDTDLISFLAFDHHRLD